MPCDATILLYPPFKTALEDRLSNMPKDLRARIFETFRTPSRQASLYQAGNTRATAWQSWHQYGLAVDMVFLDEAGKVTWQGDWDALGAHMKNDQIRWSWEWKKAYEKGHFEWRQDIHINDARTIVMRDGVLALWAKLSGVSV